jgi:hypothetical protein
MRTRSEPVPPVQCTELHRNEPESILRATAGATIDCKVAPDGLPDLQSIVDAWTDLPEAIKAGMLAMVRAAISKGG